MSTMNRLANCHNKYQTNAKRVLCLCSAGLLRSPTTANVLHQTYGYNTRAAGVSKEYALIQVDDVLLQWADEIVCVNGEVEEELRRLHDLPQGTVLVTLDVPDIYEWNNAELKGIILEQYDNRPKTEIG